MKKHVKRLCALAAVLGLGGFATANANVNVGLEPQSHLILWATVVLCDQDQDGRENEVCVEGHTGQVVRVLIDATLSAVPGAPGTTFLGQ